MRRSMLTYADLFSRGGGGIAGGGAGKRRKPPYIKAPGMRRRMLTYADVCSRGGGGIDGGGAEKRRKPPFRHGEVLKGYSDAHAYKYKSTCLPVQKYKY
jgi:hypothetical protein